MPYYNKQRKVWVGRVKPRGMRTMYKTFPTKKNALAWETDARRNPQKMKIDMGYALLQWSNDYLDYAEKYSPKTYQEKLSTFKRLFQMHSNTLLVTEFTPDHAQTYLNKQNKVRSGYAANKDRKNLSAAWEWGKKIKGIPQINPFRLIDKYAEKRKAIYIPPLDDFFKVYDMANEQDRVILLAYLYTAARKDEVFRLRWADDIDFGNEAIRLYTRKRRDGSEEYHWLPMTEELFSALLEHKQNSGDNEFVFNDPATGFRYLYRQRWLKNMCRRAKVRYFNWHSIRHLTSHILMREKADLGEIQEVLRHKSANTTARYLERIGSTKPTLKLVSNRTKGKLKNKSANKSASRKLTQNGK